MNKPQKMVNIEFLEGCTMISIRLSVARLLSISNKCGEWLAPVKIWEWYKLDSMVNKPVFGWNFLPELVIKVIYFETSQMETSKGLRGEGMDDNTVFLFGNNLLHEPWHIYSGLCLFWNMFYRTGIIHFNDLHFQFGLLQK